MFKTQFSTQLNLKMLLFGFLLLPVVIATQRQLNINNYIINIEDNTLTNIRATENSTDELNLSNLNLQHINKHVFDHLNNIKMLNLSKNSLKRIRSQTFIYLTNLDHLDLSNNKISNLTNIFVGLKNLKSVNISKNNVENLDRGSFFGLSNSSKIIVEKYMLKTISTEIFENPCFDPDFSVTSDENQSNDIKEILEPLDKSLRVKICIEKKIVKSLEIKRNNEDIPIGCSDVMIDNNLRKLFLSSIGIMGFEKGWYKLQNFPINEIDLNSNGIVEVTREMLNDLPPSLKKVTLRGNEIGRLGKGIIENEYLRTLDLGYNNIREIEDGAFEKMNLTGSLYLDHNLLRSGKFVATLPPNLKELSLNKNFISDIPTGSFSKLGKLTNLKLGRNLITTVQRQSLSGLSGKNLRNLDLWGNLIKKLENGAFYDLKKSGLRRFYVSTNPIEIIEGGLFDDV